ncbi:uncharacterized protein LOC141851926 [Brevipalpus obovatus]|uniref:uncharacterized protein LOC141851926 n=1 Tax=Brevipalpus obovatus TaxID=246614 RepID=UPI003D9E1846
MSQNRTFSQGGSDYSSVNVEGFGMMDLAPYNSALSSQSSQGFRFSQETTERMDDCVVIPVSTQDYVQQFKDKKPSKRDVQDPLLARSLVLTQIKPFHAHHADDHYSENMDTDEDQRVAENLANTGHAGYSQIFFEQLTPNPSPLSQADSKFEFYGHENSNEQAQDLRGDGRPETPGKWYNGSAIQCDSSSSLMSVQSDVSIRSARRSSTSSTSISSKPSAKKECNRMASKKLRERKNRERRDLEARYEAAKEEKRKRLMVLLKYLEEMDRVYDALIVQIDVRGEEK